MLNIRLFDTLGNELKELYQWDTNVAILVNNKSNVDITSAYFSNSDDGTALKVVPDEDGRISVPNALLADKQMLKIHLVSDTRTVCDFSVPVKQRAKPEEYIYTEEELSEYKQLEQRIEDLEEQFGSAEQQIDNINGEVI